MQIMQFFCIICILLKKQLLLEKKCEAMLIEFNVGNFLSFRDISTLSMVGVRSYKEHEDTNVIKLNDKAKLLKAAVVYGNNASGKSNLIRSISFMRWLVIHSFRDALLEESDKKIPLVKFLLNSRSEKEPSSFEVTFISNSIRYRYGFEVEENEIESEWLFHTTSKEVPLFTREKGKISINRSSFKEGLDLKNKTKKNVLFLTVVAQFNGEISNRVIEWFKNFNVINGIHDRSFKRYTINKLKEDVEFQKWVNKFIKYLEISRITTIEEEVSDIDVEKLKEQEKDEELINFLTSIQKLKARETKRDQIITWHRKYDENNIFVDTIPFAFDRQESEGTKKLIYLLGPWYDTLRNGKILIVDELDSRLHTNLIKKLVGFFHQTNETNAQLIFAVHDTNLLSRDIFRRDQIWFIEKNQFGASELYSLGDFKSEKVRKKSAFDKNYEQGKYGAIPYFVNEEEIISSLYGKEK